MKTATNLHKQQRVILTLLDDRNMTSESVWNSFQEAVEHGEEMLSANIGWIHYTATNGEEKLSCTL